MGRTTRGRTERTGQRLAAGKLAAGMAKPKVPTMKDEELAGQAWHRGAGLQSKLLAKGGGRTTNSRPKKTEDVSSVGGRLPGMYKHHLLPCSKQHTEQDILGRKLAAQ